MGELSIVEKNILIKLQNGRVTREELKGVTGLTDRESRILINSMRKKGVPIISSSRQKGYWLAKDKTECKSFGKEILHRVKEEQAIAHGVLSKKAKKFYVGG
ncbi:MAG: hypothetical protein ACQEQF_00770 [Bacillota bacterium]